MEKKRITGLVLGMWMFSLFGAMPAWAAASPGPGSVVINEVAWAGSADSAGDEWIELYNTTSSPVDLSGWMIEDDGVPFALNGVVPAHGYFLIEDSEGAVNPNGADLIVNLSLANTGDALVLKDDVGTVIDTVNGSGGAWPAGSAGTNATMERIDVLISGNDAANWASSNGGSGATASAGAPIVGTPGALNSVSALPATMASVMMNVSNPAPNVGESVTIAVEVAGASDLFSYGFEMSYDPAVLSLQNVTQGPFLNDSGSVATSFQASLEDGQAGTLLVAEARTIDPKGGISGSGLLYAVTFDVIGGDGQQTDIIFDPASFIGDTAGETAVSLNNAQLAPQTANVDPVGNVTVLEASSRYSIQLSWNPVAGVDAYRVYRKDPHGFWILLDETASALFVDSDAMVTGGNIVPFVNYEYQVVSVKNGNESLPSLASGMETRGLTGDNDRSDRVDGRDLDNLARHFAETDADGGFDPLVDTTYDGMIDGSDLIDLGVNFALTYQP